MTKFVYVFKGNSIRYFPHEYAAKPVPYFHIDISIRWNYDVITEIDNHYHKMNVNPSFVLIDIICAVYVQANQFNQ